MVSKQVTVIVRLRAKALLAEPMELTRWRKVD